VVAELVTSANIPSHTCYFEDGAFLVTALKFTGIGLSIAVTFGIALMDGVASAASLVTHVQPNRLVETGWEIQAHQTRQATQSQFTVEIIPKTTPLPSSFSASVAIIALSPNATSIQGVQTLDCATHQSIHCDFSIPDSMLPNPQLGFVLEIPVVIQGDGQRPVGDHRYPILMPSATFLYFNLNEIPQKLFEKLILRAQSACKINFSNSFSGNSDLALVSTSGFQRRFAPPKPAFTVRALRARTVNAKGARSEVTPRIAPEDRALSRWNLRWSLTGLGSLLSRTIARFKPERFAWWALLTTQIP
jgi:hypothetical protein